jgi:dephospho-CoA kinase
MIIGITGTLGAGKGTVAGYLNKKHKFSYISVRNFLAAEVLQRGLMATRENIIATANDLRAIYGADYITEQLLSHVVTQKNDVVIESIRTPGEAAYLKSHGAQLWAVVAALTSCYAHVSSDKADAEKISFEAFAADVERDLVSTNTREHTLLQVIKNADVVIRNEGTKEELFMQVEAILQKSK